MRLARGPRPSSTCDLGILNKNFVLVCQMHPVWHNNTAALRDRAICHGIILCNLLGAFESVIKASERLTTLNRVFVAPLLVRLWQIVHIHQERALSLRLQVIVYIVQELTLKLDQIIFLLSEWVDCSV